MEIEKIEISKLIYDPENARKHGEKNLEAIKGSLEKFGQQKPIVISSENIVVAGNGTAEAAESLGWKTINCVRVPSDWSEVKIKAFALADNRTAELAEWNAEVLHHQILEIQESGFDIKELNFNPKDLPDLEPTDSIDTLDNKEPKFCPECGHDITDY